MLFGKNYDNVFQFSKFIRQNTVVYFPEAVCDNVVSDDVTIMSSLRSDAIILRINFPFS